MSSEMPFDGLMVSRPVDISTDSVDALAFNGRFPRHHDSRSHGPLSMTGRTGMKRTKRKGGRLWSDKAIRANGTHVKDTFQASLPRTGDLAIYIRAPGTDTYLPFDGNGAGAEPMRWPFQHRQHVNAIARSMAEMNPGYDVEVRYLPDTAFETVTIADFEQSYRPDLKELRFDGRNETKRIRGQTDIGAFRPREVPGRAVAPMYDDPFDDPLYEPTMDGWDDPHPDDLPGFVSAADYPLVRDMPEQVSPVPMETYATQTYGVNVVTAPVGGRLTPDRKANAIGQSIAEMTCGRTRPLKDTIRKGVYYGVVQTDAPEIGESRRMLVTGKVIDNGDRTYGVDLTQSDTGSPYMDVPRSYMAMLDPPQTEQDIEYRCRVGERFDGDGRPWDDRRYEVSGRPTSIGNVVAKLSRFTGRTEREVVADPELRGMRVHDSMDMGSEGTLVRTFGRRFRR